jgi:hypothetical protein
LLLKRDVIVFQCRHFPKTQHLNESDPQMNDISKQFQEWLVQIRRDFHMYPETAYEEVRTTDRIAAILVELGLEVRRFEDMTGVVGLLQSGQDGSTVGLRADKSLNCVRTKSKSW